MILCTSSNGSVLDVTTNTDGGGTGQSETLYYLDTTSPRIVQSIEPRDSVRAGCKFVQVEVTQVQNPKKYPLTFTVEYQPAGTANIELGSFSLYPPDHPGSFIVATRGKVRNEGAVRLSLVLPDDVDRRDTVRVAIKRIKFL